MNLFKINNSLHPTDVNALKVVTPLGFLFYECKFINRSISNIPPARTEMDGSNTIISCWSFDDCVVEFLGLNFNPKLPIGMKVEQCICGIWRIRALKEMNCRFSCYLETNLEGSAESGERLYAQSFEDENNILTIGTEDEECFAYRARSDYWFPPRLNSEKEADQFKYLPHGLGINLPDLLDGETLQVHFVSAWTSKQNREISTWFAVDADVPEILKQANIS